MLKRAALLVAASTALGGCTTAQLYGLQSASGGTTATVTSSYVAATSATQNARASFSFGQPVPVSAPGGQLRYSGGGGSGVFAVGVAIFGLLDYIAGDARPTPLAPDTRISHTCSCYGYTPEPAER